MPQPQRHIQAGSQASGSENSELLARIARELIYQDITSEQGPSLSREAARLLRRVSRFSPKRASAGGNGP